MKTYQFTVICAWCKKDMGAKPGAQRADLISHGMCEACRVEMTKQITALKKRVAA